MYNKRYESLFNRVKLLESLVYEGKRDLDLLKSYLGDDLYDSYISIRNKIPSDSDLNKQYPEFTKDDITNDEKLFIKKYFNVRNSNIVAGLGENLFSKYPKSISSEDLRNNTEQCINDYDDMVNFVKQSFDSFRDFEKLKKMDTDDIRDFVNSYTSVRASKDSDKLNGATKLYEDSDWVVYRITSYNAAKYYGKHTKWCISGNYPGHEGLGERYFKDYIRRYNLDGGYYFYINKNDQYTKFCILQKDNGMIHSIWNAADTNMGKSNVDLQNDLPEVKGINLKRTKSKKDLLLRAINYDDGETVKELVNNGLNPNIIIKGKSALFLAIDKDKVNSAKALLESGADADAADAGGYTLIDKACRKTDRKVANEIVRLLIKYSNDISDETFNNICKFCDYLTVKTLLDSGYTPNSESLDNATRLISSDTALKVELLLNAGANPNERDEHGNTVLFYLSIWDTKEAKEVINVLLEHGAKMN